MSIHLLLWACPLCRAMDGIDHDGRCRHCGAAFRRVRGAAIEATSPDGSRQIAPPAAWVDRLPDPESLLDGDPIRAARVIARAASGSSVVRSRGAYLNRIETYGPDTPGTLELGPDRAIYLPEGSESFRWPFDDLTAVQASSSTLQLKGRGHPLVSFRFPDDSVYLWEMLVRAALRVWYRRTGKGEVVEFQPRIATR